MKVFLVCTAVASLALQRPLHVRLTSMVLCELPPP